MPKVSFLLSSSSRNLQLPDYHIAGQEGAIVLECEMDLVLKKKNKKNKKTFGQQQPPWLQCGCKLTARGIDSNHDSAPLFSKILDVAVTLTQLAVPSKKATFL